MGEPNGIRYFSFSANLYLKTNCPQIIRRIFLPWGWFIGYKYKKHLWILGLEQPGLQAPFFRYLLFYISVLIRLFRINPVLLKI
jgi:hypothetical protein